MSAPRRVEDAPCEELPDGETVVLSPDRTRAVMLNPVGGAVWELCDGRRTPEEITAIISAHFPEASPEQVARDVAAFLDELRAAGLLQ